MKSAKGALIANLIAITQKAHCPSADVPNIQARPHTGDMKMGEISPGGGLLSNSSIDQAILAP